MKKELSHDPSLTAASETSSERGSAQPHLPPPKPKHLETKGEHKFNFLTYNVVGYMANTLISILALLWVERTHSGQKSLSWLSEKVAKIPGIKKESADFLVNKTFFLTGGFAVLVPMKWLEDAKSKLVKQWNRSIYGDKVDTDPVLLQSQKELDTAPKQSWSSIFSSRMLALVPFYLTVGLLWDRKSILARITNPEMRALSKEAIKTMEATKPLEFANIASKGIYVDRFIVAASRNVGRFISWASGDMEALEKLNTLRKESPGIMKQGAVGAVGRDSLHSTLPYYFASEAITSGAVAWGVFAISRIMGPLLGNKKQAAPTAAEVAVTEPASTPVAEKIAENSVAKPSNKVEAKTVEHDAPTAQLAAARA